MAREKVFVSFVSYFHNAAADCSCEDNVRRFHVFTLRWLPHTRQSRVRHRLHSAAWLRRRWWGEDRRGEERGGGQIKDERTVYWKIKMDEREAAEKAPFPPSRSVRDWVGSFFFPSCPSTAIVRAARWMLQTWCYNTLPDTWSISVAASRDI